MNIQFNDGIKFNTEGEYRLTRKSDGYYVVGKGCLIPVNNAEEGKEIIESLKSNSKEWKK